MQDIGYSQTQHSPCLFITSCRMGYPSSLGLSNFLFTVHTQVSRKYKPPVLHLERHQNSQRHGTPWQLWINLFNMCHYGLISCACKMPQAICRKSNKFGSEMLGQKTLAQGGLVETAGVSRGETHHSAELVAFPSSFSFFWRHAHSMIVTYWTNLSPWSIDFCGPCFSQHTALWRAFFLHCKHIQHPPRLVCFKQDFLVPHLR